MRRLQALSPGLNWQLIVPVVGGAVLAVGLAFVLCFAVAATGGDGATVAFGLPALVTVPAGLLAVLSARRLRAMPLRARDGFLAVTLAWLAAAVVGTAPLLLAGTFDRPVDAFFESMSGITTTGASLLDRVEAEPDAILLWRSLSQWLGGVGIVVLVVAIAPATGLAGQRVFYAEMSGFARERLTPRIAETAKIIWAIYLGLTTLCVVGFALAGMGVFDALNHGLTTIATGGFSTRTASLAAFDSVPVELVAIAGMAASGVNFAFYWRALRGRDSLWPQLAEIRAYLLILAGSIAVVTVSLLVSSETVGGWQALRDSAFTVTSIVTTTGFTTADFDEWDDFARMLMVLLMFVGACAGSTAGGMKVIRVLLLFKTAAQEVQRQLQPKAVQVLRVRGRVYSEDVRRGVLGFFYIYVVVFLVATLVMAALGLDVVTATSSAVASLNIIGPGLGEVGATENYGAIPDAGLWFLSFLMLAGRLEVFTVLVLLTPAFWRRTIA